ncbi:MAG: aldo/keto reductase [Acidobacteria bacterium]|nr:aldo/keto reductase [Acidobacteriota bacterium]
MSEFLQGCFGPEAWPVHRLGLSTTNRPGERAIRAALDCGVNYLFGYAIDTQLTSVMRSTKPAQREKLLLATGGYNWIVTHTSLKRSLENALRRYRTDYIDVFHFLGVMKPEQFPPRIQDELAALRETGKVRAISISCHDRPFAGQLAAQGKVDALMVRYSAAHPGAERDVFPHIAEHKTGIISYTATRWGRLLVRPRGWPTGEPIATAGQCFRFVLTNPHVQVALTAPSSEDQLMHNLREVEKGRLAEDEMAFMRRFGAYVHDHAGWFMGGR